MEEELNYEKLKSWLKVRIMYDESSKFKRAVTMIKSKHVKKANDEQIDEERKSEHYGPTR